MTRALSLHPERAVVLAGVLASALAAGCRAPAGNDPNVPDDELPFGGGSAEAGAPSAVACPSLLPRSCASIPSYAAVVQPLVSRSCLPMCHQTGGTASDRDFSTYAKLAGLGFSVLTPVSTCLMPPPDAGPDAALSVPERAELAQWIVCGSPDN